MPSLRFRGLTVAKEPNVPLRRFSIRVRVERGAKVVSPGGAAGVVVTPRSGQIELSVGSAKSSSVRAFSSPGSREVGWGAVALPPSADTVRARLAGLRGDVRRRMAGRVILALGG